MRSMFKNKYRLVGVTTAFVILVGLAFIAGTVSGSHNTSFAQSTAPTPSPTATPQPNDTKEGTETADGPQGTEQAGGNEQDGDNQAALQAQAKITVEQAKQTALTKVPGTVVSANLEGENGTVVYNVVVTPTAGGTNQEVKVNAVDGTVLKVETDGEQGDKGGKD